MNTLFTNKFGYVGYGSYIYHVEQLSISIKIKVMAREMNAHEKASLKAFMDALKQSFKFK